MSPTTNERMEAQWEEIGLSQKHFGQVACGTEGEGCCWEFGEGKSCMIVRRETLKHARSLAQSLGRYFHTIMPPRERGSERAREGGEVAFLALLSLPAAAAIKRLRSSSHSWHLQGGDQYLLRTLFAYFSSQSLADSCSPGETPSRAESLPAHNVPKNFFFCSCCSPCSESLIRVT